jgi:LysR family glycine cleavage system transcriptional activator
MSLQISTPFELPVFERDLDIAVYYPTPNMPDAIVCEQLFNELLTPVVSPTLARNGHAITEPEDLAHHVLLHSLTRVRDWRLWLEAAGATQVDAESGLRFENPGLVYQGVTEGVGVAVAQLHFVTDDLLSGRLLAPFRLVKRLDAGYHLVFPKDRLANPSVRAFHDWILEEAAKSKNLVQRAFPWIEMA